MAALRDGRAAVAEQRREAPRHAQHFGQRAELRGLLGLARDVRALGHEAADPLLLVRERVDVRVLDHFIIGQGDTLSFAERGLL